MNVRLPILAMLLAGTALGSPAFAQSTPSTTEPPSSVQPTLTDRASAAIGSLTGNPMATVDADMKRVLDALAELKPKPIEDLEPAEARQQPTVADGVKQLMKSQGQAAAPEAGVQVKDVTYQAAGGSQPARVYVPEGATGPLPVIVYYHGGGWVIADIDVYDATPRSIAKRANAIVVSPEYRRAPENKFPAAHDDAFAAYQWVLKEAKNWNGDPSRIAVLGESAGGNLAINVSIMARDRNVQVPNAQVLVYPVAGVNMDTPSYNDSASAKPLNKAMMGWFVKHVVKSDADKADPRIDLIGKADLKGLPPTTIITAQIDPLRSDGQLLADKLKAAGVTVEARNYEGVTHEFFGLASVVAKAKAAQEFAATNLKQALSQPATTGQGAPAPR